MDIYANESEQLEQLKKWWHEYGNAIIVGIVLAIVLGFAWRFWQQHREQQLEHASMRYEQLLTNVVNGNVDAVQAQAKRLMERYPHTPYAELAAMQLARQMVYQNNLPGAEVQLRWVMKHGDNKALRQVARLRLARVLLAEGQADEALKVLKKVDDKSYVAVIDETKGDVLLAQKKTADAYQAYTDATKAFPGFQMMQPLLQMKLDYLQGNKNQVGAS